MSHTPEPWTTSPVDRRVYPDGPAGQFIRGPDRIIIAEVLPCDVSDLAEQDSRRIVACVNACAGISTESLERGDLTDLLDLVNQMLKDPPQTFLCYPLTRYIHQLRSTQKPTE